MKSRSHGQPNEVLNKLLVASAELVRASDSALGAALDVPPPSVEPVAHSVDPTKKELLEELRGLAYRSARKIYRALKRFEALQPLLARLRDEYRRRF